MRMLITAAGYHSSLWLGCLVYLQVLCVTALSFPLSAMHRALRACSVVTVLLSACLLAASTAATPRPPVEHAMDVWTRIIGGSPTPLGKFPGIVKLEASVPPNSLKLWYAMCAILGHAAWSLTLLLPCAAAVL